ncbi:MAG: hypothetical protein SNJ71_01660, partial [Bacteroidales bacterium]
MNNIFGLDTTKDKHIIVLIDPDKITINQAVSLIENTKEIASLYFIGSSYLTSDLNYFISEIKPFTSKKIII